MFISLLVSGCTAVTSAAFAQAAPPPVANQAAAATTPADGDDARARFAKVFSRRSITNPKMLLAPTASFDIKGNPAPIGTGVGLNLGASFAVMDELLVDATIVPAVFAPAAKYNNPLVGATYRIINGQFELGAQAQLSLPFDGSFFMRAGVPVRYHLTDMSRIDAAAYLTVTAKPGTVGMQIPLQYSHNITEEIYVGARTGFIIGDFSAASATMAIPLGIVGAYTIPASTGGPLLDVGPSFTFDTFFTPGGAKAVTPDFWTLSLAGTFYLGL
ncbi:MAG: hypothetical protein U0169_00715 [Polyangiaceae bacterium]